MTRSHLHANRSPSTACNPPRPLQEAKAKLQQEQGEGAAAAGGSKPLPAFGALPTKDTATELDLTEEVMETVMSYLQVRGVSVCAQTFEGLVEGMGWMCARTRGR